MSDQKPPTDEIDYTVTHQVWVLDREATTACTCGLQVGCRPSASALFAAFIEEHQAAIGQESTPQRAITCSECRRVLAYRGTDAAVVFPRGVPGGHLIHPDDSRCDMGVSA